MDNTKLQNIKNRYGIIGNDAKLNYAIDLAMQIAKTDLSVLVTGENGVGKEIIPHIIHDNSLRKSKKFIAINCGSIPEGTIDSELFGHVKGSFTDAVNDRQGYFSVADGGTLFLDEVGELPLSTQARLLRVLESGEFIKVGSSDVCKTNVRIIAATNVDIPRAIKEGRFRQDLYYRLNAIPINIPPLRERGEDIYLLFRKFVLDTCEKYHMTEPISLNDEAKNMLLSYSWPGNIRQLKNITENMSVTANERLITPDLLRLYLPEEMRGGQLITTAEANKHNSFETERELLYKVLFEMREDISNLKKIVNEMNNNRQDLRSDIHTVRTITNIGEDEYIEAEKVEHEEKNRSLEDIDKENIYKALKRNQGSRKNTASELGISERTLLRKINKYGFEEFK
ncbi:MAG: sigma-54-dependent Fis family transcriptional regulator [Prevotellaceae bacterium]|nr:sigma-54-dependent Fis family transcriptional regulator [Candidatus Faecinaster equi]